jgi:hypothetical protein
MKHNIPHELSSSLTFYMLIYLTKALALQVYMSRIPFIHIKIDRPPAQRRPTVSLYEEPLLVSMVSRHPRLPVLDPAAGHAHVLRVKAGPPRTGQQSLEYPVLYQPSCLSGYRLREYEPACRRLEVVLPSCYRIPYVR